MCTSNYITKELKLISDYFGSRNGFCKNAYLFHRKAGSEVVWDCWEHFYFLTPPSSRGPGCQWRREQGRDPAWCVAWTWSWSPVWAGLWWDVWQHSLTILGLLLFVVLSLWKVLLIQSMRGQLNKHWLTTDCNWTGNDTIIDGRETPRHN